MREEGQSEVDGGGGRPAPPAVFPAPARRLALACLVLRVGLDLAVAGICPLHGGDCLYGLFSLVVAPVMVAGLLGTVLPRAARWAGWSRAGQVLACLAGAVLVAALVGSGHVAAVGFANALDYGGVLVKPRLLAVTLGLAAVYYLALAGIGLFRPAQSGGD
jgi:hypothetical protein